MVQRPSLEITEAEAALYDRQIRLWGLDAQNRLRNASVLLIGVCGLGAEIAKNLLLAGINSLTLVDSESVTEVDLHSQFFVRRSSLGKNRAEESLERCKLLNPMVRVSTHSFPLQDDFYRQFDVVCLIGQPYEEQLRVNKLCRGFKVKFFAGGVFGSFGFSFSDLLSHEYAEEITLDSKEETIDSRSNSSEPASKRARSDPERKPVEKTMVKKVESFVDMENAFSVDWSLKSNVDKLRRGQIPSAYFVIQALFRFKQIEGRFPSEAYAADDARALLLMRDEILAMQSIPDGMVKISDEFAKICFGQLSPVCAIVGGVIGQEVIKKDQPINNLFLCNAMGAGDLGVVAKFPPS